MREIWTQRRQQVMFLQLNLKGQTKPLNYRACLDIAADNVSIAPISLLSSPSARSPTAAMWRTESTPSTGLRVPRDSSRHFQYFCFFIPHSCARDTHTTYTLGEKNGFTVQGDKETSLPSTLCLPVSHGFIKFGRVSVSLTGACVGIYIRLLWVTAGESHLTWLHCQ